MFSSYNGVASPNIIEDGDMFVLVLLGVDLGVCLPDLGVLRPSLLGVPVKKEKKNEFRNTMLHLITKKYVL